MSGDQKKNKIKILMVEDDIITRRSLLDFFRKDKDIDICAFFTSGFDIISEIKFYKPDVVITDFLATDINGAKILKSVNLLLKEDKPKIIVTSYTDNVSVLEQSFKLGINYYIKKPIILSLLKDAVLMVCKDKTKVVSYSTERKIRIKSLLRKIEVPNNILGYTYIEEALDYMINAHKIVSLSEIYEKIGTAHETSLKCVEASIRNAVRKAANICNDDFKKFFSFCKYCPSNSIFLSTLKEKLMIEEINDLH